MNRYRSGGPSKATATTLCQKCLKKGHYTYECTAAQQERPYVSRPSRSQQFLNPKLAPKLSAAIPPVPDTKPSTVEQEKGQQSKKSRTRGSPSRTRRSRSSSVYSSDSVSTISTNRSRSSSRSQEKRRRANDVRPRHEMSRNSSRGSRRRRSPIESASRSERLPSRRHRDDDLDVANKRSHHDSPRKRARSITPERSATDARRARHRSRSRSPYRGIDTRKAPRHSPQRPIRERSLSPYSRRIALTREKGGA